MNETHDPITCGACGAVNPWMNESCRLCNAPLRPTADEAPEPPRAEEETDEWTPPSSEDGAPSAAEPAADTDVEGDAVAPTDEPAEKDRLEEDPLETLPWMPAARKKARDAAPSTYRPHTWNPLWILLGIVIFLAIFVAGQFLIMRYIIANDPDLKAKVEDFNQRQAAAMRAGEKGEQHVLPDVVAEELRDALLGNTLLVVTGVLVMLLPPLLVGGLLTRKTGALRNGALASAAGAVVMMVLSQQLMYGLIFGALYGGLGLLGGVIVRKLFSRLARPTGTS